MTHTHAHTLCCLRRIPQSSCCWLFTDLPLEWGLYFHSFSWQLSLCVLIFVWETPGYSVRCFHGKLSFHRPFITFFFPSAWCFLSCIIFSGFPFLVLNIAGLVPWAFPVCFSVPKLFRSHHLLNYSQHWNCGRNFNITILLFLNWKSSVGPPGLRTFQCVSPKNASYLWANLIEKLHSLIDNVEFGDAHLSFLCEWVNETI